MTGFVTANARAPSGTWDFVIDSGVPSRKWGKVCWNKAGLDSSFTVRIRAGTSVADASTKAPVSVPNCISLCNSNTEVQGQVLLVQVTLQAGLPSDPEPVLYDLTVSCCGDDSSCGPGGWMHSIQFPYAGTIPYRQWRSIIQ